MPKIGFDSANVRNSGTSFPTLKLAQGEVARVVLAERQPTFEWTHRLSKPKLSPVTGKLITKDIQLKDGTKRTVPDDEFVGNPICLGDSAILADRGADPDHCPICKAALDYPDWFQAPERRFAVHVLKYATKSGSAQVTQPLSLTSLVWKMSENRYAKVVGVIEEFAPSDGEGLIPTKVDMALGPCTNGNFQNYDINGTPKCIVAENEENWKRAQETFDNNNAGDLSRYCGRPAEMRYVKNDVDEIISRWLKSQEAESGGNSAQYSAPDLSDTLATSGAGLIEGRAGSSQPEAPTADLSSLDDTIGSSSTESGSGLDEFKPAEQPGASNTPANTVVDFESLLGDLGSK